MPPRHESAARAASRPPRRKRFGQHFLHDPAVIERIVTAIRPEPQQHLVEIGPGRGALTRRLLQGRPASLDASAMIVNAGFALPCVGITEPSVM